MIIVSILTLAPFVYACARE